jgi:sulfatase maturation enzyme AslB (radical SAM superfamily)
MYCPRLEHFTRLNRDGSVGKCGHMLNAKGFDTLEALDRSKWLQDVKDTMSKDKWPAECLRCEKSEQVKGESVRTNSIERHKILKPLRDDYLIVGGVLDNICNSACQTCNSNLSTKIGALESKKDFPRVDNYDLFKKLPQERIIEFDVNGGEPTASKNYKKILMNLPVNVKIVRMNTNGSRMIGEIEKVLKRGITVIVTMSLDGTNKVHDYARWPIKWTDYVETMEAYRELQKKYKSLKLDCWTTVSALNVNNLPEIVEFCKSKNIPHDWAFLTMPRALDVRYKNVFTERAKTLYPNHVAIDKDNTDQLMEFINKQDALRGIDYKDYLNFLPK